MIEFDVSKVVVEVDGRQVIGFCGTRPTMPTDTEMLDWMEENSVSVGSDWGEYYIYSEYITQDRRYPSLRAAISAAMAKEAK